MEAIGYSMHLGAPVQWLLVLHEWSLVMHVWACWMLVLAWAFGQDTVEWQYIGVGVGVGMLDVGVGTTACTACI